MRTALPLSCFIAAVLLLSTQNAESGSAQNRKSEIQKQIVQPTFRTILNWLPTDTETLVVTKGPYQIDVQAENKSRPSPLIKYLEPLSYMPFASLREGIYLKKLEGQKIALAVEGARAFRSPKELGLWPYEGCHILVFSRGLGKVGEDLQKAWAADAFKVQRMEGHDVYFFQEKLEKDVWKFFIARPAANVVLCATDQAYLAELLKRMARPGAKRAFPDNLPEWKQVDINARWWAIRHFSKPGAFDAGAPLSIDPRAVGLTFSYSPDPKQDAKSSVRIKYLSASKSARKIATKYYFDQSTKWITKVRQRVPGVISITVEFGDAQAQDFWLVLLWHLGHMFNV